MYTLIIKDSSGVQTAFNDGLGDFDATYLIGKNGSDFYPGDTTRLELKSDILINNFITHVSSSNDCNRHSFVTYDTTGVPILPNIDYRISAPLLESGGSDSVNSYNKYWNYSQLEYFIDSLPDWYGDWSSHEFSVYIQSYLQSTEKLAALIQKANDKGWTIYENY